MKILIVEDNNELAKSIRHALRDIGVSRIALGGDIALAEVDDSFDVIILDLGLPGFSGLNVCKAIRSQGYNMPIIVVTGRDKPQSIVELLDAGADDYLTKPFHTKELQARVRALGRRKETRVPQTNSLHIGDLTLDLDRHCAIRQDMIIPLRNKEFFILEELMKHPDMVLSRASLIDRAWEHDETIWNNLVDVQINHLRDKIDRPFGKDTIETVHGVGYRIRDNAKKMVRKVVK